MISDTVTRLLPRMGWNDVDTLSRDEIFDVLSNQRRQCVLHYLKCNSDTEWVDLGDLVDYVTAWETNTSIIDIDSTARKRVYNALHQSHLPRLDDVGVIVYDHDHSRVALTNAARDAQLYLEYLPDRDIPWQVHYLWLTGLTVSLTVIAWLGIYPFNLSDIVLLTFVLVAFVFSSVVHAYHTRKNRLGTADRFEIPSE